MRSNLLPGFLGLTLFVTGCSAAPSNGEVGGASDPHEIIAAEHEEITGIATRFLAALSTADTAALSGLLAQGASIHSLRDGGSGPLLRAVSREAFLEGLGGEVQSFLERMWDPTVLVQDGVAMVWAPYDFHREGEFSHCGIDVFTLLKSMEGWQVTNISYNVVREGCPSSPLGPPEEGGS